MAGRRSESAHRKVLDAAVALIAERGVDATSMDAIAGASGVSKATIYNHWADKETLLLEVMADVNCLDLRPKFDSGDIRADLIAVLSYRPRERREARERMMPHFLAYSARNPEFGLAWRKMVMEPPRRELKHLLKRGIAKGDFQSQQDFDPWLAMLLGPILYWHIFLRRAEEDPKGLAEAAVDAFFRAFATQTQKPKSRSRGSRAAHTKAPERIAVRP